ncbi:hypothetical protein RUND412_006698 [Rhizina undulata]
MSEPSSFYKTSRAYFEALFCSIFNSAKSIIKKTKHCTYDIDTVPTEILREILSHVPDRDLGSVRLVNHFFNAAANDRYFRTIRVPFTNATIEILEHLSHQPHVARCVQHLIYPYCLDTSFLPSGEDSDTGEDSDAKEAYEQRRSQDAVPQEIFDVVKFALSKMPNIREITMNLDGGNFEDDDHEWLETSIIRDTHLDFYTNEHINWIEIVLLWTEAFGELLAGVSQAQIRLDKLKINWIWRGILTEEVNAIWKYTPLFQNLTSLTVLFVTDGSGPDCKCMLADAYEGRIFKFLSSAPNLKKLSLGLPNWEIFYLSIIASNVGPITTPFAKIFGDNYVWKHLEAFYFNPRGGSMHAEELMHFWARHSATLNIFGLYHPHLETGTWREVFDFIKGQPEKCLENIVILGPSQDAEGGGRRIHWRGDFNKKINDYVLHGGQPFPPTEAELEEQGLEGYYYGEVVQNPFDDEDDASIQLTNVDDFDDYYVDEYAFEDPEYDSEF